MNAPPGISSAAPGAVEVGNNYSLVFWFLPKQAR
jgi:hypothetical protein